ncbi:MAG: 3D domain-containing protein [Pseudobdellovibrionaceae bacterium]
MDKNKMRIIPLLLTCTLISCAASKSGSGLVLTPTIYYKPTVHLNKAKCSSSALRDIKTPDDQILETVCEQDFKECLREGSCFIENNGKITSYNFHSIINGEARFIEVDIKRCPYGYGVMGSCLDPYFSVAADLNYYSAGDVIFIPRLIGVVLPTGEVHNGYIIIRDSGGDISGPGRFDFFTGFLNHLSRDNPFARIGLGDLKNRFEYRIASEAEAKIVRQKRNYPRIP